MRPFTQSREAVRVKVKKYEGKQPPEIQKFSVDPQLTSLDVLQSILIKAFNLQDDFSLSYKIANDGTEEYMGLFSDWDLDAAFLRAQNVYGTEPCVHLRVEVKPHSDNTKPDENCANNVKWTHKKSNVPFKNPTQNSTEQKTNQFGFQGIFMNQMEKTLSMVSRALNLSDDPDVPLYPPLNDAKFRSFLDPIGQVIDAAGLREVIYYGGIDPSLRRVVWKHILNVYPEGMSGKQRMDYMKKKSLEYYSLRDVWRDCAQKRQVSSDLMYVTSMVKKDVLRTDRHHKHYAGSDDNQNIASLFNILTTYALNHPQVSYCQGMSDLASPLLVTMGDEAHAYICFCALMTRLYPNFLLDGEAMTLKFSHLTESLQVYDPQFYTYLKNQQADDLLFCYRWLLLEMKREFAFDDALRMLEVLWSSLPPHPPNDDLLLKDKSFCPMQDESEVPISPLVKNLRENAYTKLCAIRRQHSSVSLSAVSTTKTYKRMNQSLDENIGKKCESPVSLQLSKEFQSLDDGVIGKSKFNNLSGSNQNILSKAVTSSWNSVTSGEQDNYSELVDEDEERGSIRQYSESKEELLESTNSPLQTDLSPIKIIENFNDFKKLSQLGQLNKCSNKANTVSEIQLVNNHTTNNSVAKGTEPMKSYDNVLKESEYEDSSPDDSKDYSPMTTSFTTELKIESENFDKAICRQWTDSQLSTDSYTKGFEEDDKCTPVYNDNLDDKNININGLKSNISNNPFAEHMQSTSKGSDIFLWENPLPEQCHGIDDINLPLNLCKSNTNSMVNNLCDDNDKTVSSLAANCSVKPMSNTLPRGTKSNSKFFSNMSQELENARKNCEVLLNNKKAANLNSISVTISNFQNKYENLHLPNNDSHKSNVSGSQESSEPHTKQIASQLPPPQSFGGGNPFLMFLSLTVLIQHRDYIMNNRMDYNELAMHFDKMVRKHNVNRVLNQARQMYTEYLKHQGVANVK